MKLFNIELRRRKIRNEYKNENNIVSRWAQPPDMNTSEWLRMFSKSPRLAVVERIASDIANIGGKLFKIQKDGFEVEVKDHPFLEFMTQPNPLYEMTSSAMWRLHEIYLLLVGESFFLIERDEYGLPAELWNVPPHWIKMTPYLGNPTYTMISPNGNSRTIPVGDMFVMKQLNPLDPFLRGLGIAESIADEVEIDEYAAKFQKRFFYNDATPPTVFLMPDATDEQRETFLARWNQKFRGVDNSHRAAALSGNVEIKSLADTGSKNLAFVESRVAMRDAVLEHFGVPREIMGITENSNRSTADAAQYIYAKNVLTPRVKSREEAINKQLLPMFGENLVWRYDVIIPYDKDFDKAKALEAYNAGLITKNEARELLSLGSLSGGDIFKMSLNDLFIHKDEDPAEISQTLLEDEPIAQATSGAKAKRMNSIAALRLEDKAIRENEVLFQAAITRHFKEEHAEIVKALNLKAADTVFDPLEEFIQPDGNFDQEAWNNQSEEEQHQLALLVVLGLISWTLQSKKLLKLFNPLWKRAYADGAKLSKVFYSLGNLNEPEFISAAKIYGGKRIVGIEATTQKHIADIIAKGISKGVSQSKLRRMIQDEMDISKIRAKIIARQETMTAISTGQFDMMKSAGATTKTWHHTPQKNPRDGTHGPNHVILDGQTVEIDKRFANGLRFPRDPEDNRPEELINCRCYLTYDGF